MPPHAGTIPTNLLLVNRYVEQLETCLSRVMTLVVGEEATRQLFHGQFAQQVACLYRLTQSLAAPPGPHTLRRKTILPKSGGLFDFIKRGAEAVAINEAASVAYSAGAGGGGSMSLADEVLQDCGDGDEAMAAAKPKAATAAAKRAASETKAAAAPKKAKRAKSAAAVPAGGGIASFFTKATPPS